MPSKRELEKTVSHVQDLSRSAEKEIHTVVLTCHRSRGQALAELSALDRDNSQHH